MPTTSTPEQRALIGKYLRELADLMNLRDWHLSVMHATPQDDGAAKGYLAMVGTDMGRWEARIYFRNDFWKEEPDVVRETCVHELLHIHRRQISELNDRTIKAVLSTDMWNTWLEAYTMFDEKATEAIALFVVKFAPPFPGWPDDSPEPAPADPAPTGESADPDA